MRSPHDYNLAMDDYSSVKVGSLFFGATAVANTLKEQPIRYEQVEEGMQIIISNKLGAMPAMSVYILAKWMKVFQSWRATTYR